MKNELKFPDISDWIYSVADATLGADQILAEQALQPISDETIELASDLISRGLPELASVLFEPYFYVKKSEIELSLLLEKQKSIGGGLGVGIVGFPPALSYQVRYGETENRSSKLKITVYRVEIPLEMGAAEN